MCPNLLSYPMTSSDGFDIDTMVVAGGDRLPTISAIRAGARKNYFVQWIGRQMIIYPVESLIVASHMECSARKDLLRFVSLHMDLNLIKLN